MRIQTANVSDKGNTRDINQDAIVVKTLKRRKHMLAVGAVFDGIGGLEHGELASGLLAQELTEWIGLLPSKIDLLKVEPDILFAHFADEAELLNEKLYMFMRKYGIHTGSTMSAIMIVKDQYYIIQVGDSRIYRFHQFLEQLTDDETKYEEKEGRIRKKLTNYMGKNENLDFLSYHGKVHPGDWFFVCSDGFYHHFLATDLIRLIHDNFKEKELEHELKMLVDQMILRGESDNISVGIIHCDFEKRSGLFRKNRRVQSDAGS